MSETQFLNPESAYGGGYNKDVCFRFIILEHLQRIAKFASCEMRGGYWETRINANTNTEIKIYIEDTREVFSNAVQCFADMLAPYFDEEMINAEEQTHKEDDEIYNKKAVIIETEREDANPEESYRYERKFKDISDRISYRTERARIYRKLFRHLCCFLYRLKYLEVADAIN